MASLRALLGIASLALSALTALGCEEAPTSKGPNTAGDPAEQARIEQGKKKIDDAKRASNAKNYDKARKLLKEAAALAIESQRADIDTETEKLDKREAKLWGNEGLDKFKEKDCNEGFKALAAPIKKLESETFTRDVRHRVGAEALKCLQTMLDEKVLAAAYADARKLTADADINAVLGQAAVKKAAQELEVTILDALKGQIADDLKAKKWGAAVEKIDASQKKGDANEEQAAALLASVRDGITPEINALATKALGQRDAPQSLKQVDALIKLVHWEVMAPDVAALAKDKALPDDIAKKREALAVWVEAQRVTLKALKKPEKRWAHGKIALLPATKIDGESKRDIPHGTELWILGTTKDGRALLAGSDPGAGPLTVMLDKVLGWAPTDRLMKEATSDWLVPDDQLKGERVWGPLRKDEPMYELGVVSEVSGKDITVKRIADDAPIKVTRKQLRNGRLTPGTRVITFCTAKDQPAQIMETPINRTVKLKCDGGQEKEDVLAGLRSKPEILPPSK